MILVDPAIGSKELVEPLRALGLEAAPSAIDADIAFEGRGVGGSPVTVGVEYKKLHELVQALRTERLQGHQLLKMQAFDYRWLLIEGPVEVLEGYLARWTSVKGRKKLVRMEGSMTLVELHRRLLTLQIAGGLTPVFVRTQYESLKFIEALYRCWTDVDQDQHKSHIAIYEPPTLVPPTQFERTLFTLPGLGRDKVRRAQAKFGSIQRAILGQIAEWTSIEGVGRKTAERIVNTVYRDYR